MYKTIYKTYTNEENITYVGYGVENIEQNVRIENITTDEKALNKWVSILNKSDISNIHIYDMVNDFLVS